MNHASFLLLVALAFGCATPAGVEVPLVISPARIQLDSGIEALGNSELDRGIDLCEAALKLAADDAELRAEAHTWLVHGYTRVDDPESALTHAALAIELHPEDPWLRYAQGIALQKLGLFEDAVDSLNHAIDLNPAHIKAVQWRAHIEQSLGRYSASIKDWERALQLLAQTDDAVLASWGGDKATMTATCLRALAECKDALGE